MKTIFFFICLFVLTLIIEVSVIRAMNGIVATTPLLFAVGILIAHRIKAEYGTAWYLASAIALAFVQSSFATSCAFLASAIAVYFFETRLFATRSIYAVISLGLATFAIFLTTKIAVAFVSNKLILNATIDQLLPTLLMLVIALYTGSMTGRLLQKTLGKRFYLK